MPTVEDFKKQSKRLLDDIEEYERLRKVVDPYKLLTNIAKVLEVGAGLVSSLVIPAAVLKWSAKILLAYVKVKNDSTGN